MKTDAEYRNRRMSPDGEPSPTKHHNALIKMAQVWKILAHDREKKLLRGAPTYIK